MVKPWWSRMESNRIPSPSCRPVIKCETPRTLRSLPADFVCFFVLMSRSVQDYTVTQWPYDMRGPRGQTRCQATRISPTYMYINIHRSARGVIESHFFALEKTAWLFWAPQSRIAQLTSEVEPRGPAQKSRRDSVVWEFATDPSRPTGMRKAHFSVSHFRGWFYFSFLFFGVSDSIPAAGKAIYCRFLVARHWYYAAF